MASNGTAVPCVPAVPAPYRPWGASAVPPPFRDPAPYAEDFSVWAAAHCVFRDGCSGGVAVLGKHFCAWCAARGDAGPWPATFAALLREEGFHCPERGMVYGLLLREDWEAAQPAPKPPEQLPMFGMAMQP